MPLMFRNSPEIYHAQNWYTCSHSWGTLIIYFPDLLSRDPLDFLLPVQSLTACMHKNADTHTQAHTQTHAQAIAFSLSVARTNYPRLTQITVRRGTTTVTYAVVHSPASPYGPGPSCVTVQSNTRTPLQNPGALYWGWNGRAHAMKGLW